MFLVTKHDVLVTIPFLYANAQSAGKYDEITVWVRIEEGTRVQKSRSRFVIHIRVSEDKAIKSPRASGCGADSPGLPRRIKLTDPPGTQRGE